MDNLFSTHPDTRRTASPHCWSWPRPWAVGRGARPPASRARAARPPRGGTGARSAAALGLSPMANGIRPTTRASRRSRLAHDARTRVASGLPVRGSPASRHRRGAARRGSRSTTPPRRLPPTAGSTRPIVGPAPRHLRSRPSARARHRSSTRSMPPERQQPAQPPLRADPGRGRRPDPFSRRARPRRRRSLAIRHVCVPKDAQSPGSRLLGNALLRRLARDAGHAWRSCPTAGASSVTPDLAWRAAGGPRPMAGTDAIAIAAMHRERGPHSTSPVKADPAGWAERTRRHRAADRLGLAPVGRAARRSPGLPGFDEGAWWVQ